MAQLHNKIDKRVLKKRLLAEPFMRITVSFYRYVLINNTATLRDELWQKWNDLEVFGRVYLAPEGINAQMSVPEHNWKKFAEELFAHAEFKNVPFKIAVEDDGKSFYKLIVRVKKKIVADGLKDETFDVTNVGKHLNAEEFNTALDMPGTIVVDMRNHYESEVGRFENAICPDADTFKEELPMVVDMLKDKKDQKLLLYCTGGIRCEKASAYMKHHGFKDVNQLYGGIIQYAKEIKHKKIKSKFIGKNFVFDERMGERITNDIIANCHQCGDTCDTHVNCANDDCHLLFIQCNTCAQKMNNCCSEKCKTIALLPIEEQRKKRKGKIKTNAHAVHKSRLRPKPQKLA